MDDLRDFYADLSDEQMAALRDEWQATVESANYARASAEGAAKRAGRHVRAIDYELGKRKRIVHHINGDLRDNSPGNLRIVNATEH